MLLLALGAAGDAGARRHHGKAPKKGALELIRKGAVCEGTALIASAPPKDAPAQEELIAALLPHLLAEDAMAQTCARDALNKLDVLPVLQPALGDAARREEALQQAGQLSHPALLPLYQGLSKDPSPEVRGRVAAALKNQAPGAPTVDLLRGLVADPVKSVRYFAIDSLGMLLAGGCDPARAILIQRRQKEVDPSLRSFLEKALR